MNRNKALPGTRLFLYVGTLIGIARTTEEFVAEAETPKVPIDPTTHAEGPDVNAKAVWIAGAGVLLALWAIVLLLYPLFQYFKYERTGGKDPAKVLAYVPKLPPPPRIGEDESPILRDFRARETAMLNSYRWVDRGQGIVSMPIDRAIQLLAQRGIPPSQPGGNDYYPPSAGNMRTGFEGKVKPEPPI